jgi:hypothetical protein
VFSFRATKSIFSATRTQEFFRGSAFARVISPLKKKIVFGAVLLSCLVTELQKPSSPGLEPRTDFRGYGLCSCNLLAETNNSGLGTVLLSSLVFELQKPSSPGLKPRTPFRSFNLSKLSSWFQEINIPSLGEIRFSVLELREHTYQQFQLYV